MHPAALPGPPRPRRAVERHPGRGPGPRPGRNRPRRSSSRPSGSCRPSRTRRSSASSAPRPTGRSRSRTTRRATTSGFSSSARTPRNRPRSRITARRTTEARCRRQRRMSGTKRTGQEPLPAEPVLAAGARGRAPGDRVPTGMIIRPPTASWSSRGGHLGRGRGDDDGVEGRLFRPAGPAVADAVANAGVAQAVQDGPGVPRRATRRSRPSRPRPASSARTAVW